MLSQLLVELDGINVSIVSSITCVRHSLKITKVTEARHRDSSDKSTRYVGCSFNQTW